MRAPPGPAPMYSIPGHFPGMVAHGNLDLNARPIVTNPDGSISTVHSTSFGIGGHEVLVPTVIFHNGAFRVVDPHTALLNYMRTGQNLGVFRNPASANAYAIQLHLQQAGQRG